MATPLVEVGIDIPRANLMCIESGERFGLASLHQLRGRVGRQGQTAFCLVFTGSHPSPKSLYRLKVLEKVNSGFDLADADLNLRGPGDLYGTQQSGFIDLKIASLTDLSLIRQTHQAAKDLLQTPNLYPPISAKLESLLENPNKGL